MGYLAGLPVVILQGRVHRYEGIADHQARYPVRCMHAGVSGAHHHQRCR